MNRSLIARRRVSMASLMCCAAWTGSSYAISLTTGATAPSIDQLDVANLPAATGGNSIWSDRPITGQTFTTGNDWGELNAITVQIQTGAGTTLGWKDYLVRFGAVSLGTSNTISVDVSEVVRQDADIASDSYFTFTFDTPLVLMPDTQYGFDIGLSASQEGWQSGIPAVRTSGDSYASGQNYTGGRPATPGTDLNLNNNDLVFHADIDDLPGTGFLTLQADTSTGAMMIKGGSFADTDINYYQVTSAGNSLAPAVWDSLTDQDFDGNGPANGTGNGWEEAGGNHAGSIAEGYLLGMSTIDVDQQVVIGGAYDTAVNAQDLVFTYRTEEGDIIEGVIEYVSTAIPGDTDGDGDVDDSDLGTSFSNYTGPVGDAGKTAADGDNDGDGDVDDSDLGTSFSNYTGPIAVNVPEPASLVLFGLGLAAVGLRRR